MEIVRRKLILVMDCFDEFFLLIRVNLGPLKRYGFVLVFFIKGIKLTVPT